MEAPIAIRAVHQRSASVLQQALTSSPDESCGSRFSSDWKRIRGGSVVSRDASSVASTLARQQAQRQWVRAYKGLDVAHLRGSQALARCWRHAFHHRISRTSSPPFRPARRLTQMDRWVTVSSYTALEYRVKPSRLLKQDLQRPAGRGSALGSTLGGGNWRRNPAKVRILTTLSAPSMVNTVAAADVRRCTAVRTCETALHFQSGRHSGVDLYAESQTAPEVSPCSSTFICACSLPRRRCAGAPGR